MQETNKIWMNGELVDWADATVHVGVHGLHYGSGVFEGIRAYETPKGTAVFRLSEHLKRLELSAGIPREERHTAPVVAMQPAAPQFRQVRSFGPRRRVRRFASGR